MIEKVAIWMAVGIPVALMMEPWSRWVHDRVWHGWFYVFHRSHHQETPGHLEANDILSVSHAPVAIALILFGCIGPEGWFREVCYGVGLGMTAFGVAYTTVHDGYIHGRLPVGFLRRFPVMERIRKAHMAHHVTGGLPFGLFLGPQELRRRQLASGPGGSSGTRNSVTG